MVKKISGSHICVDTNLSTIRTYLYFELIKGLEKLNPLMMSQVDVYINHSPVDSKMYLLANDILSQSLREFSRGQSG